MQSGNPHRQKKTLLTHRRCSDAPHGVDTSHTVENPESQGEFRKRKRLRRETLVRAIDAFLQGTCCFWMALAICFVI